MLPDVAVSRWQRFQDWCARCKGERKHKVSYKKIDKYVDLVRMTLDPDDDMQIEFDIQDDYQHIKIVVFDRVLN